jgi:cold shock CspA family protein
MRPQHWHGKRRNNRRRRSIARVYIPLLVRRSRQLTRRPITRVRRDLVAIDSLNRKTQSKLKSTLADMASVGIVRFWHRDEGWGVIDSPDTPGGCWAHFSHLWNDRVPEPGPGEVVEVSGGFREMFEGETVDFDWETRARMATLSARLRCALADGNHRIAISAATKSTNGRTGRAESWPHLVRRVPRPVIVGVHGFEPRTFRSQSERASQTAPHPVCSVRVHSGHVINELSRAFTGIPLEKIRTCNLLGPNQVRFTSCATSRLARMEGLEPPKSRLWRPLLYQLRLHPYRTVASLELATFSFED